MCKSRVKSGFTLIELLVVIATIAVLIALLLPAVQQAREAARRTQCKNNLKQLGLAMHNYHDAHGILPSGAYHPSDATKLALGHSWAEMILPFIDQAPLYDAIDFNSPSRGGTNPATLNGKLIPGMACPSDPDSGLQNNAREPNYLPGGSGTFSMAASYAPSGGPLNTNECPIASNGNNCKGANGGSGTIIAGVPFGKPGPGMFNGGPKAYRIRDCIDGTSNTFLMGEMLPIYNSFGHYFLTALTVGSTNPPPNYLTSTLKATCPKAFTGRSNPASPCLYASMGFQSMHAGGVHMLLADGTVRFIGENISYTTWTFLGDRADGQILGEF